MSNVIELVRRIAHFRTFRLRSLLLFMGFIPAVVFVAVRIASVTSPQYTGKVLAAMSSAGFMRYQICIDKQCWDREINAHRPEATACLEISVSLSDHRFKSYAVRNTNARGDSLNDARSYFDPAQSNRAVPSEIAAYGDQLIHVVDIELAKYDDSPTTKQSDRKWYLPQCSQEFDLEMLYDVLVSAP